MKLEKPKRINGRVPVLSAQDAVNYIPDEATLCVLGAGGGILEATSLITALADRYKTTQSPRDLSLISPTRLGDRAERGISPLAQEGLVKWALCGHWGAITAYFQSGRTEQDRCLQLPARGADANHSRFCRSPAGHFEQYRYWYLCRSASTGRQAE